MAGEFVGVRFEHIFEEWTGGKVSAAVASFLLRIVLKLTDLYPALSRSKFDFFPQNLQICTGFCPTPRLTDLYHTPGMSNGQQFEETVVVIAGASSALAVPLYHPGKNVFLSESGNEKYCTDA